MTEINDKYIRILKPHWLSSDIIDFIPQAQLLMCVMVFMHGQICGSFTLILCVCLCAQVTTQGHAGNDMVVNHTPQMVCVDLWVQNVCLLFQFCKSLWEADVQWCLGSSECV